jgi:outer membrane protein OmpA-like peptidoglycan-associated protein
MSTSKGLALAAVIVLSLAAQPAHADLEWLGVRLEGGGSYMLSDHQRVELGYEAGFQGVVRPYIQVLDPITIQLGVGGYGFPSGERFGGIFMVGGGVRVEPRLGDVGRIYLDGDAYYARTGDLDRVALDIGWGFEFDVVPFFSIGPYVRYVHLFSSGDEDGGDAMMLAFGVSLSLHGGSVPSDSDDDGVTDVDDGCPQTPAGPTPDPARRGCPLEDSDDDEIIDREDLCPNDPAGETPDPARRGCPLSDTDNDGVNDPDDLCVNEPAGDHPDATRRGCPTPDTDGDGVHDPEDRCVSAPAGEFPDPNRPGCPDGDADNDTVRDATDQCPTEAQGFYPDPARPGCPLADGDGDRVPDVNDACPTQPGAPSQNPRRNGCPSLVRLELDRITIQRPVFFATGRDTILARSTAVLTALADALQAVPQIRRISIEGHTDDVGDDAANLDLSNRRANTVMQWLIDHGVDASRLEAHGFGETQPIETGTSARARAANRRVEFRVIDPAPSAPGLVEPIRVEVAPAP